MFSLPRAVGPYLCFLFGSSYGFIQELVFAFLRRESGEKAIDQNQCVHGRIEHSLPQYATIKIRLQTAKGASIYNTAQKRKSLQSVCIFSEIFKIFFSKYDFYSNFESSLANGLFRRVFAFSTKFLKNSFDTFFAFYR